MSSVVVASDTLLYVNGEIFSQVSGFTWTSSTQQTPRYAVDSLMPYEIVPGPAIVQGTVNVFKTQGDGGIEGAGFTTQFRTLASQKYLKIALMQRSTSQLLFQAVYCSVTSQSWNDPVKGLYTGNFSFIGILFSTDSVQGSTNG